MKAYPSIEMWKFLTFALFSIACITTALFVGWSMLFEARNLNEPSKEALVQMHAALNLGDSKAQTDEVIRRFETERNIARKSLHKDTWEVGMPSEFGASDWVLYLQFDDNELLSAVAMRTSDGLYRNPWDALQDKGILKEPSSD